MTLNVIRGSKPCRWVMEGSRGLGFPDSQLLIQKMTGEGRPGGGLHCRLSGAPSSTSITSTFSLGHRGDSGTGSTGTA